MENQKNTSNINVLAVILSMRFSTASLNGENKEMKDNDGIEFKHYHSETSAVRTSGVAEVIEHKQEER